MTTTPPSFNFDTIVNNGYQSHLMNHWWIEKKMKKLGKVTFKRNECRMTTTPPRFLIPMQRMYVIVGE